MQLGVLRNALLHYIQVNASLYFEFQKAGLLELAAQKKIVWDIEQNLLESMRLVATGEIFKQYRELNDQVQPLNSSNRLDLQ